MAIDVEQQMYVMIPLDRIISGLSVRRLSPSGIERLKESMRRSGFLDSYPLVVISLGDGTYRRIDGAHRCEAAKELGISSVPCLIKTEMPENDLYKLALQCNEAAETVVPSTLVTHVEFIRARKEKYSLFEVGEMLGWSEAKTKQYSALSAINEKAWEFIVTDFEKCSNPSTDGGVTKEVTGVTFSEFILRDILALVADQQVELVQSLASGEIKKSRFTEIAKAYRARNEMKAYSLARLGELGEPYTTQLIEAVYSGAYDVDWKVAEHPKLHKLLASLRDEWERKNSIHLIYGDFYEEVKKLGDGSIDLILTDPPYNIARENEFELEGRSSISQDFGEWDKYSNLQFIDLFTTWAREWARLLRDQGSGYVFTSDSYISHLRIALETAGLHVKATLIWHKTNPGTQVVKTNFKSSIEYLLFFTKGEGGHTFNWLGENEMHNFISAPICAGNERVVDAKGNILHPTQKPEQVLRHLAEVSSNRGDTIFDGFMGVGSTGSIAKKLGRKFIGMEQEKIFFDAVVRRLADG